MPQAVSLKVNESRYRLDIFPCLPCWREIDQIADKKVQGIALNTLEKIVHWFASWFTSYRSLIDEKKTRIRAFGSGVVYINDVLDRTHPMLFDCTRDKVAKTLNVPLPNQNRYRSYLTLNDYKVFFNEDLNRHLLFSSETTREVVVSDWGSTSFQIEIRYPVQEGQAEPHVDTYTVDLIRDFRPNAIVPDLYVRGELHLRGLRPENIYVARLVPPQQIHQAPVPERAPAH